MYTEYNLNEFATRCFRNTGDGDYIVARLAYRSEQYPQFLWSSLQAIEKYLKYILLMNRIDGRQVRHDLGRGVKIIRSDAPFDLRLSENAQGFIKYLDRFARFRYFETMYNYNGDELCNLDRTVWEIRRYCQPTISTFERKKRPERDHMASVSKYIKRTEESPPYDFRIHGGALEKVLENKSHPSRAPLIWYNRYYSRQSGDPARISMGRGFVNSPLAMHPEMIEDVLKYVFLPKDVVKAFREVVLERQKAAAIQDRKSK